MYPTLLIKTGGSEKKFGNTVKEKRECRKEFYQGPFVKFTSQLRR